MQQGPKGKKGKKKKKNVGVGDTGAARLNEECCAVRELVGRSELDFDEKYLNFEQKTPKKIGACGGPASGGACGGPLGLPPQTPFTPELCPTT